MQNKEPCLGYPFSHPCVCVCACVVYVSPFPPPFPFYPFAFYFLPFTLCSNACFGFDKTTGWTFFDLTSMHDNLENNEGTVLEADFYHADQLLPRSDEDLVAKASKLNIIIIIIRYILQGSC